jgi:pimeloyl-ACP methyl ester carboxylesterase
MNRVTSKDGTIIAYDAVGAGPTLILVGGAMSYRLFPGFVKLANLLAGDFRVVNYDRRGRGDSGDTAPYAVQREVEDLEAVIAANGETALVWGMSSGAALAVTAAASGAAIDKLALYEPPYMVLPGGRRPPDDHQEQLQRLANAGRSGEAVSFFLKRCMGAPAVVVALMHALPFWPRLKAVAHTLPYDAAVMGDYGLPKETLQAVDVPTLVIGGEKSDPRLRLAVDAVAATLPKGQLRVLDGQRHNVSMDVLAPVLREFFAAGVVAR